MKHGLFGILPAMAAFGLAMLLAPAATPAESNTVTITLLMANCERCIVTAYHTPNWQRDGMFQLKATVHGGKVELVVPQAETVGMSFDVVSPDFAGALGGDALPVIAMGFQGYPPGTVITKAMTRSRGQKANWCWAGTNASITITVRKYLHRVAHPRPWTSSMTDVYFWASPSQVTYRDVANMRAAKAMGHQDSPYCGQD